MEKALAYFRLVRWINLVILFLSLFFFQYFIIVPVFNSIGVEPTLNALHFCLLALSIVLVCAAGNVINDYFDFKMDKEFKPDRVLIGKYLSLDDAYTLHFVLNLIGIAIAMYVGWKVGNYQLAYLFILAAIALWVYSSFLKKYFLIGNLVVAFLSASVFILLVLFERKLFIPAIDYSMDLARTGIAIQLKGYMSFAFLTSFIRELVKDVEDRVGDEAYRLKTLPVVLGFPISKVIIHLLIVVLMSAIGFVETIYWQGEAFKQFWYSIFMIQLPLLLTIFLLLRAKIEAEMKSISWTLKLVMLTGIATMPLFYYFQLHTT